MKKTYQIPETVTMKIATSMILSASDPQVGLDKDATVNPGEVESRRSNNIWGEEDEEDF